MGESRSPIHVALYGSSYAILFDDGSWSSDGLPNTLTKKMKRAKSNIEFLTLGPGEQWFVRLANGRVFYNVEDENLVDELENSTIRPYKLWFNNNVGYIVQYTDLSLFSDEIPNDFHNKLNGRQKSLPKVKNVAFGPNDTWWVSFQDDTARWSEDIPSYISKHLMRTTFLVLDPTNESSYYLSKENDNLKWQVNDGFDNDMNDNDDDDDVRNINPQLIRYTQSSISNQFSDGNSIEELRHELENGITTVDEIPMIDVVQTRSGNMWTLNNRRLWCFRHACNIHRVPVRIVDKRPYWFNKRIPQLQNPFDIRIRGASEESDFYSESDDGLNSADYDWY